MNEQTIELVREAIAGAGNLGGMAYEAAYRHAIVSGISNIIGAAVICALAYGLLRGSRYYRDKAADSSSSRFSYDDDLLGAACLMITAAIAAAIACGVFLDGITRLLAPEWAAIQSLLETILL